MMGIMAMAIPFFGFVSFADSPSVISDEFMRNIVVLALHSFGHVFLLLPLVCVLLFTFNRGQAAEKLLMPMIR
jgi:hypothetical protein